MNNDTLYNVSFRCFYDDENGTHFTTHYNPAFPMGDIPRWIDAYAFTHPNVASISAKVWLRSAPDACAK